MSDQDNCKLENVMREAEDHMIDFLKDKKIYQVEI